MAKSIFDDRWLIERYLEGKTAYWNALAQRARPFLVRTFALHTGTSSQEAEKLADEALAIAQQSLRPLLEGTAPPKRDFVDWVFGLGIHSLKRKGTDGGGSI